MLDALNRKRKGNKGFTLIELIVVIAILAILALLLVPRFAGFTENAKEKADAATAKTIQTAITALIAEGKLSGDGTITMTNTGTISASGITCSGPDDMQTAIEKLTGKNYKAQSKPNGFTVTVTSGGISVAAY